MIKLHMRGIKLGMTLAPYNTTALAAQGHAAVMQTRESRTQPWDAKEGARRRAHQPDGTLSKGLGSYFRRDKKQMFHKSSLSRFIK